MALRFRLGSLLFAVALLLFCASGAFAAEEATDLDADVVAVGEDDAAGAEAPAAGEEAVSPDGQDDSVGDAAASQAGYWKTFSFENLLQYTIFNEGSYVPDTGDVKIQYHYPAEGGLLMVQCVPVPTAYEYTEEAVYGTLFPSFFQSIDDATDNPVRYWEKRFVCHGFYGLRSKATYTADGLQSHDDTFCIATPEYLFSFHFADSKTYGLYPADSILYVVASINILVD